MDTMFDVSSEKENKAFHQLSFDGALNSPLVLSERRRKHAARQAGSITLALRPGTEVAEVKGQVDGQTSRDCSFSKLVLEPARG